MAAVRPHLLGPWRRAFQWGTTLLLLAVPFVRVEGRSLLRLDLPTRSLLAFGRTFRIEELYPFPAEAYRAILDRYGHAREIVWCQEEPQNQGAWY